MASILTRCANSASGQTICSSASGADSTEANSARSSATTVRNPSQCARWTTARPTWPPPKTTTVGFFPIGSTKTSTSPPHTPGSPSAGLLREYGVIRGWPSANASSASAITRLSSSPPPIEPSIEPSSKTIILLPACRGTEPWARMTVHRATGCPLRSASVRRSKRRSTIFDHRRAPLNPLPCPLPLGEQLTLCQAASQGEGEDSLGVGGASRPPPPPQTPPPPPPPQAATTPP